MYDDDSASRSKIILGVGGGVFVLLLVLAYFVFARKPESIPAPTAFVPFEASDKSFEGEGPKGWQRRRSVGLGGMGSGVRFEHAAASIVIASDLQGSLMGDIARANNAQFENMAGMLPEGMQNAMPKAVPPVEALHIAGKKAAAKDLKDYDEKPIQPLESPLGEGRTCEFTGEKEGLIGGGKQHGYRVMILGGERRISVFCQCPDRDWNTLKPAFQRVIGSLKPGKQ